MASDDSDSRRSFSRRTALQGAAGAISVGALTGKVVGKGEDTVSIPVLVARGEVKRRRQVPKKWWNHVKRVRRLHAEVEQERENKRGVKSVHITTGDESINGRPRTAVGLRYHPGQFEGNRENEQRDGVKIKKEAESAKGKPGGCTNTGAFPDMPGGVQNRGDDANGTSGFPVYHPQDDQVEMVTAAHLFDGCTEPVRGLTLFQDNTDAGSAEHPHAQEDWVTIKDDSPFRDYSFEVATGTRRDPIDGAVVNYEALMTSNEAVYQMGKATGETAGHLKDYKVTGDPASDVACVDFNGEGVRIASGSQYFGEGDSGGPIYQRFSGGSVGIVSLGALGYNYAGTHNCNNGGTVWSECEGIASKHISDQGFDFVAP